MTPLTDGNAADGKTGQNILLRPFAESVRAQKFHYFSVADPDTVDCRKGIINCNYRVIRLFLTGKFLQTLLWDSDTPPMHRAVLCLYIIIAQKSEKTPRQKRCLNASCKPVVYITAYRSLSTVLLCNMC